MPENLSSADRLIRIAIAVLFVILVLSNVVTGTFGVALWVLAAVLLLTSLFSFCPIYHLLKISSYHKVKKV